MWSKNVVVVKDYDDDATCLTTAVAIVVVAYVTLLADSTNLAADTKAVSNATDGKRLISPLPSLFSPFGALLSFYSKWGEGGREGTGRRGGSNYPRAF